ncbi:MAG TPA: 5'-3' exonuclease H3TH domain-containing protein, partial [Bdellovibrionota bacterium]|nr:5'-3' exonuclease H3TH domain-containing protein [Bdellovibrionota bacterium]
MPTLFLIDGSAYFYRAYYAIRSLNTSKGFPTNAIYGFSSMLHKLIKEKEPHYLAIVFDSKEPTFREAIFKEYKANRAEMPEDLAQQIPYIKSVVDAFQIPAVQKPGYEADDLIGAIVEQLREDKQLRIIVVSSDKDLMQLVNDQVEMYDPAHREGPKTYHAKEVEQKFGIPPEHVTDVLALMGDSSDNIPGVPGVGPKTASKLIEEYGNLEKLLESAREIKKEGLRENLQKFADQARLSLKLVRLHTDVGEKYSLKDFSYSGPDPDKIIDLFRKLEFSRLLKDFDIKRSEARADESGVGEKGYTSITDKKTFQEWIKVLRESRRFAFDTETDSLDHLKAKLVGCSFAYEDSAGIRAAYLPLRHETSLIPTQLPVEECHQELKPLLEDPSVKKIAQNLKYDYMIMKREGITIHGLGDDTMLMSYCL